MKRTVLTDGTGRWFDLEGATRYEEALWFNGRDFISCSARYKGFHEELFKVGSCWVKHTWDKNKFFNDEWVLLSKTEAAKWFSTNNYEEPPEELSEEYEKLRLV